MKYHTSVHISLAKATHTACLTSQKEEKCNLTMCQESEENRTICEYP